MFYAKWLLAYYNPSIGGVSGLKKKMFIAALNTLKLQEVILGLFKMLLP
ncbi:MAG: hypothetical protein LBC82_04740 [Oscillospiraceae bacterium]|jgi:hypothetical protein|nr:hypothetical protein [Oscillospiraceae bacterium]